MTIEETVPAPLAGERVDRVVAMITGISRSSVVELIRTGGVRVDDRVVTRPADRLETGQRLRIDTIADTEPDRPGPDPDVPVTVVHEDESIIVVDKAAGQVVHPGAGHEGSTLVNGLLARYPELADVGEPGRPGIVHRLDRGTSGLLVVARTEDARRTLGAQLQDRSMLRRYLALVWGGPDTPQGLIDAPLGRSPRHPTKMTVLADGRDARTHYEVLERFSDPVEVSLLGCRLETGRTHQIRVHLSAIGHAVVGDDRYGGVRQSLPCPRPFLHAAELGFEHPDGGPVRFESALPADLVAVRDRLD